MVQTTWLPAHFIPFNFILTRPWDKARDGSNFEAEVKYILDGKGYMVSPSDPARLVKVP